MLCFITVKINVKLECVCIPDTLVSLVLSSSEDSNIGEIIYSKEPDFVTLIGLLLHVKCIK